MPLTRKTDAVGSPACTRAGGSDLATPPAYSRAYAIASAPVSGSVTKGTLARTRTATARAPSALAGTRTMPEPMTRMGPVAVSERGGEPNWAHAGSGWAGGGV